MKQEELNRGQNQVWNQVHDQVCAQIQDQARKDVRKQVRDQIGIQVLGYVWCQIGEQTHRKIIEDIRWIKVS